MEQKSDKDLKSKTIFNIAWRFAERCGAQGVSFVVSIILARLLAPETYGTIALITVFTTILQVFVDSGLGNSLIQKKNADDLDFSTVFYFNIFLCCVFYIGMFHTAPHIASFYNDPTLSPVVRVLSLTLIISGVKNVQQAYVSKHMLFKFFFFATLGGTIGAAVVGIFMAYHGFGVWSLVVQQVLNATVDTVILWLTVKWRPKLIFSFHRLKELFSYGWKLLASSLVNTVYNDIRQLIIGRLYSSVDLAYYNRGKQFPSFIVNNINSSIDSVLLPVMAENQDNKERVKNMTRRSIMASSYLMWPLMFGLMAIGEPLVKLLLTNQWLPCLPFLYIFCFVHGMQPIHTANLNAIKAMGRSDLCLKMEVIKKTMGIVIILVTMNISVFAIGLGSVIYTIFASFVNAFPNKKLLGYTYFEQIRDIAPSFVLAAVMSIAVYCISFAGLNDLLAIVIQVILGAVIYLAGSRVFKLKSFHFVFDTAKIIIKK